MKPLSGVISGMKKLGWFYLIFGMGWTAGCIFEAVLFVSGRVGQWTGG